MQYRSEVKAHFNTAPAQLSDLLHNWEWHLYNSDHCVHIEFHYDLNCSEAQIEAHANAMAEVFGTEVGYLDTSDFRAIVKYKPLKALVSTEAWEEYALYMGMSEADADALPFHVGERVLIFDLPEYITFHLASKLVTVVEISEHVIIFEDETDGFRQYIATKTLAEAMENGEISIVNISQ